MCRPHFQQATFSFPYSESLKISLKMCFQGSNSREVNMAWDKSLELSGTKPLTHICVGNLTIIGSDNGLSPGRRQAIIWTNAGILLIRTSGTNFSEIFDEVDIFSFKETHLKMSIAKWQPFCLGLKVLNCTNIMLIQVLWCHISLRGHVDVLGSHWWINALELRTGVTSFLH